MVFYNEVKGDDQGPIEVEKGENPPILPRNVTSDCFCRVRRFVEFPEGAERDGSTQGPCEWYVKFPVPTFTSLTMRNRGIAGHCCRGGDPKVRTSEEEGDVIRPTFQCHSLTEPTRARKLYTDRDRRRLSTPILLASTSQRTILR